MRDLAKNFLTEDEKQAIQQAVTRAEGQTTGEVVIMVVSASHRYPMAEVCGALLCGLPLGLLLTPVVGGWLWLGHQNLWVFLVLATILSAIGAVAVRHTAWLKRLLATRAAMDEEVQEAAITSFFKNQLYCTRDQSGVLLFISVLERKVWVLADKGISQRVPEASWQDAVKRIVDGIHQKRPGPAICAAIENVGDLLAQHFPRRPDDRDELQGLIIGK